MANKSIELEEDPRIDGLNGIVTDTMVGIQLVLEGLLDLYISDPRYKDLDPDTIAAAIVDGQMRGRIDSTKIAKYISDKSKGT